MTVLLTGARGFLGSRVLSLLHEIGEEVITLGRTVPVDPGRHLTADLSDSGHDPFRLQRFHQAVGDVDWICHLGADVPKDGGRDRAMRCFETNVLGTIRLLDAFARPGQGNVIASTMEAALPPRTWYGSSKVAMEHACATWQVKHPGATLATLRFTGLYGPGDAIQRAIPNWVKAAREGVVLRVSGSGRDVRDYLQVEDAARAVMAAHLHALDGTFEVGTGIGLSMREVAEGIHARIRSSGGIMYDEARTDRPSVVVTNPRAFMERAEWAPFHRFPEGLL